MEDSLCLRWTSGQTLSDNKVDSEDDRPWSRVGGCLEADWQFLARDCDVVLANSET